MKIKQALKIAAEAQRPRRPGTAERLPPLELKPTRQPVAYDIHMNLIRTGDMIMVYRRGHFHLARVSMSRDHMARRPNATVVVAYLTRDGGRTSAKPTATLRLRDQVWALRVWKRGQPLTRDTEDEFYAALEGASNDRLD